MDFSPPGVRRQRASHDVSSPSIDSREHLLHWMRIKRAAIEEALRALPAPSERSTKASPILFGSCSSEIHNRAQGWCGHLKLDRITSRVGTTQTRQSVL